MPTTAGSISTAERRGALEDGVVMLRTEQGIGTGTLLYDGRAILTAAHVIEPIQTPADITAFFDTASGRSAHSVERVAVLPAYDSRVFGDDLALAWLSSPAPASASRHPIYRDEDESGEISELVGYGGTGTGLAGVFDDTSGTRRSVVNRLDADAGTVNNLIADNVIRDVAAGEQLVIDFDSGRVENDALGRLAGINDLGLGRFEGMIAPGDSGGPAFIDESRIAAVSSAIASLANGPVRPDIDRMLNASFGEVAVLQRVSPHQQWLDQSLRDHYPNAPTRPEEVSATVPEGDEGITHAWFMLQFTGVRDDPQQHLSVDYRTLDGTATAGEDYLATQGTLVLYPGEREAVIPVEILGDRQPEDDKAFALTVDNPVGGHFGDGVEELIVTRLITDDDGMMV